MLLLIIRLRFRSGMKKIYPERMALSEVWPLFEAGGLVHLSTVDRDQPRVRVMALTVCNQNLWVATRTGDDKVGQIRDNSNIQSSLLHEQEE